jgi:hypothetical protein
VSGQSFNVHQGGESNWLNHYFNAAAFTQNEPGTFGDSGRNIMSSDPVKTADISLNKNFTYRETYRLQFRMDMFNAFNHPIFAIPDDVNGDTNEGNITSLANKPRVMQGGLKLTF